jgi:hypothetical protein
MRTLTRAIVALALLSPAVHADDLLPGYDLLHAQPGTYHEFAGPYSIPAGFFGPGSDPFTGRVDFIGTPLGTIPGCLYGLSPETDIVLYRPTTATLPCCPWQATVPIEMVALSLVSVNPITVTYDGGTNPESWNVRWVISPVPPIPSGQMTATHLTYLGGTFDAQLPVNPRFEFVKVQPQPEPPLVFDGNLENFVVTAGPWSHSGPDGITHHPCNSDFFPAVQNGTDNLPTEAVSLNYARMVFKYAKQDWSTPSRGPSWGRLKLLYR